MIRSELRVILSAATVALVLGGCLPNIQRLEPNRELPKEFSPVKISPDDKSPAAGASLVNAGEKPATVKWKEYFVDTDLSSLIDVALKNNQELNIFMQELEISKNEIGARQGAYLPKVDIGVGAGIEKVGEYTRNGAVEENTQIAPGRNFPNPLPDFSAGVLASWEVDIWRKLRDAEKSALTRYLASVEGRNFLVTNLIAEIANSYYELLALDNQLDIVRKNIDIQTKAVEAIRFEKQGARVTELALRRFEAQLFKTRSLSFEISQKIVEAENKINFLVGRYPQPVARNSQKFSDFLPPTLKTGTPQELLQNRPDIRQAELELAAAELDINVARARFYPSLNITGGFGHSAYEAGRFLESPQSMMYSIAGGLTLPFINRKEIEALYLNSSAHQMQAVIGYERTVIQACIEVVNQLSNIENLKENYRLKSEQVKALDESISISTTLFNSARADYMEVLLTQRDALESKFDLIETKQRQLNAFVSMYRALGGGWNTEQ